MIIDFSHYTVYKVAFKRVKGEEIDILVYSYYFHSYKLNVALHFYCLHHSRDAPSAVQKLKLDP